MRLVPTRIREAATTLRTNEQLFLICLATVVIMAGQGVVSPILAQFGKSFGVSAATIGLSLGIFGLARLLLNIPLGIAADRYGRRLLLVGGPIVTAVGMVGSGLAPTIWVFLGFRFVAGAGSAMYMTCAQIYLADIAPPQSRARYIATNQGALFIGVSVGPAIGGLVAQGFGLRAPFFVVGAMALAAAAHAYLRLPETRPADRPVAVAAADGTPPRRPAARLLGSADFVTVSVVCLAVFLTRTAGQQTLLPLYADDEIGLSPGALGLVFTMISLVSLIGLGPGTMVADRLGRKWAIVPSGLLAATGIALVGTTGSPAGFVAAAFVYAVGISVVGPSPAAYAADVAPEDIRGLALGSFRSVGDLGIVLGPPLVGAIADASSISIALLATGGVMAVAVSLFGLVAQETVVRHHAEVVEDVGV